MAQRRKSRVVAIVLAIILAAAAVLGIAAGVSIHKLNGLTEETQELSTSFYAHMDDGDFDEALTSLVSLIDKIDQLNDEANTWVWNVGSYVPIIGTDVCTAREAIGIARTLTSNAFLPALEDAQALLGAFNANSFIAGVTQAVDATSALLGDIQKGSDIAAECRTQANALPESHFQKINDGIAELQEGTAKADQVLGALSNLIDEVNSIFGSPQAQS